MNAQTEPNPRPGPRTQTLETLKVCLEDVTRERESLLRFWRYVCDALGLLQRDDDGAILNHPEVEDAVAAIERLQKPERPTAVPVEEPFGIRLLREHARCALTPWERNMLDYIDALRAGLAAPAGERHRIQSIDGKPVPFTVDVLRREVEEHPEPKPLRLSVADAASLLADIDARISTSPSAPVEARQPLAASVEVADARERWRRRKQQDPALDIVRAATRRGPTT